MVTNEQLQRQDWVGCIAQTELWTPIFMVCPDLHPEIRSTLASPSSCHHPGQLPDTSNRSYWHSFTSQYLFKCKKTEKIGLRLTVDPFFTNRTFWSTSDLGHHFSYYMREQLKEQWLIVVLALLLVVELVGWAFVLEVESKTLTPLRHRLCLV